jgi:hypothetical protein
MKREFRKAVGSLWVAVVVAAFCLVPQMAFSGTVGSGGTGGVGDPTLSLTTACATDGDFSGGSGGLFLDETKAPTGTLGSFTGFLCTVPTVTTGAVAINDPAGVDGGARSDILDFVANGSNTDVYLFSVGENGFTQADANGFSVALSITEFNISGGTTGYTLYDSGNPSLNNGMGTCTYSSNGATATLSGCSNNAYLISSNTDERAPEASSIALVGTLLVLGLGFGRRVLG